MIMLGSDSFPISTVLQELNSYPEAREMMRALLRQSSCDGAIRPEATKERVNDELRIQRMGELIQQGAQKHLAARQACREDLAGASLEACERRVVRKYDDRLKRRRFP